MGRALWLADRLRLWGCRVIEQPGWETRGRDTLQPGGVICHHTATPLSWTVGQELRLVIDGRPDVDGPLCHVMLARDGVCHLVASGKANHGGEGGWRGLTGNSSVLGIEACNDGRGEAWPAVQLDAYRRCVAAMLDGIGRDAGWACAHREWTPRKIDPAGIDMTVFRADVARLLAAGPGGSDEEDDVAPTDTVDVLVTDEGTWRLTADGGIFTHRGPFHGSFFSLPVADKAKVAAPFAAISGRHGTAGYVLWDREGRHITFGPDHPDRRG